MKHLSENFTLEELTCSQYAVRHGINNTPTDPEVMSNLEILAQGLERVRKVIGKPIHVTSGYRSPKVNSGVGGSKNSAHLFGLAADINVSGMTAKDLSKCIADNAPQICFDKVINEFNSWVHISFPDIDEKPDAEVLTAIRTNNGTFYQRGLA